MGRLQYLSSEKRGRILQVVDQATETQPFPQQKESLRIKWDTFPD